MGKLAGLIAAMIEHEKGNPARAGHFLKVYGYAKTIGGLEGLPPGVQFTLEAAAVVHDIGIKPSLEKYGSSAGEYQEKEGGPAARAMLTALGFEPEATERIVFLVEHHHTYSGVDGLDYQILLEADLLVNMHEEGMPRTAVEAACERVIKTQAGKRLCRLLYVL